MKIGVIYGGEFCQGGLGYMSEELVEALTRWGHDAIIVRFSAPDDVIQFFSDDSYDAIVGFQCTYFTKLYHDRFLSELSDIPKINVLFDSPSVMNFLFKSEAQNISYLYHDEKYVSFVRQYYPQISVFHIPLCGSCGEIMTSVAKNGNLLDGFKLIKKEYDLTFFGTYVDYRKILDENADKPYRMLISRYFEKLISAPEFDARDCYFDMLRELNLEILNDKSLEVLSLVYPAEKAAFSYYREKTINTMLEGGIKIDVYSESWWDAPFSNNANLTIHPEVTYRDTFDIMAISKLSLNLFSWHKGGMTERISNILLNGTVCVTDTSSYLQDHFRNNKEMVIFELDNVEDVVNRINELLSNEEKRLNIAVEGYKVASKYYQWSSYAERLIEVLYSI